MAQIKVTDQMGIDLDGLSATTAAAALSKYVKNPLIHLIAAPELVADLKKPLRTAAPRPFSFGLSFKNTIDLGTSDTELSIQAGVKGGVRVVAKPGDTLFAKDRFGEPIAVPEGSAFMAFSILASLSPGIQTELGDLTFGFKAGSSVEFESATLFAAGPKEPTVAAALTSVMSNFCIPGDIEDLERMPVAAVATVTGRGSFKVSGAVNLATVINPLATPELPMSLGRMRVKAGVAANLGASFSVSGTYQIRVQKLSATRVHLGYYKQSGSEVQVGLSLSGSTGVALGDRELFSMVLGAISQDPKADLEMLRSGGLSNLAIDNMQKAVRASVNRTLSLAMELELSSLRSDEAAFLYEIDLLNLNEVGRAAVHEALDGDLSLMTAMEPLLPAHGIQMIRSRTDTLRKRGFKLKINLLGIMNVLTIRELVREGSVLFEPLTGSLTITDKISSKNIRIVTKPFEADGRKLRKALFEAMMITVAYRASALGASTDLSSSHTYFEFHERTNRQTMKDHLDALVCAGLLTEAAQQESLDGITDFGPSTFLLETAHDNASCEALFLDASGNPHNEDFYEQIGRDVLVALVRQGDESDFRALPPARDDLWTKMKEKGPANFHIVLPAPLRQGPALSAVIADYLTISWWASSMHRTAKKLAEMKLFVGSASLDSMLNNNQFNKHQKEFEKLLTDVVRKSPSQFGDPWGLLAMDRAASRKRPTADAMIVSPKLSIVKSRESSEQHIPASA